MSILKKHFGYVYYLIHDNGGRPFCVYINEEQNEVKIFKNSKEDNNVKHFTKLVAIYNPQKIFIGKSPLNASTEFSGGHGPHFDGNSILLKMDTNNYIFIGITIYSFTSENEIVSFVSPVGNNDVPYPYAIDSKENFYMLLEHDSGIDNAMLKIDDVSKRIDPYHYFFFVEKDISKVENIEWLYMGDEQYNMGTSAYPEEHYDDLIKRLGNQGPMYIKYKGEAKKKINKKEFVALLKKYNNKVGLKPIPNVKIIHKRI